MLKDPIVIVSYTRTPIGKFNGVLKTFSAPLLGAAAINGLFQQTPELKNVAVNDVYLGCVLPAGLGQAPARQATILANLPTTTPATTVSKVCGSGMQAVIFAFNALFFNPAQLIIAGGMESMTNAPYLLKNARFGYRFGHHEIYDHMQLDGLEDAYDVGKPMGYFADRCAKDLQLTRKQQDDYALSSFLCAREAQIAGHLKFEITPLSVQNKTAALAILQDEHPESVNLEKMPQLNPTFIADGTITPGNSSPIADGAAALAITSLKFAEQHQLTPRAIIIGYANSANSPALFPLAPIQATKLLLKNIGWTIQDVDLFEINEAFAMVALAFMQALTIPRDKVNIFGGACALGHPIGATGARILVTLTNALIQKGLKRGIATLCIGGGEATAVAIEIIG